MEREAREDERREHPRFSGKTYGVMFRKLVRPPAKSPDEYCSAKSLDISRSGMRFETDHALELGDRIQYFVHSPSGKSGREGTAQVVRIKQAGTLCQVAVEFLA